MAKKLLSLLAEEITEQGFGRYFQDAILPSGQRIGDVKSVDLSTGKPIDITISDTEVLPDKVEDDENYVGGAGSNNEPLKDNDIVDISGQSTYRRKNESLNPRKYFMLHHTAGRGTAQGVINILNNRIPRLGVQWIIDRNGIVYRGLPDGSRGAHVAYQRNSMKHVNNSNTEGVEIIASDDSDVLDLQCKSALKLVKKLGYSLSNVYTHGEVSWNKQATEGKKCKAYFVKNWETPFNLIDKNSEEIKKKVEPSKELPNNDKSGGNAKIGPKLININKLNTNNYYSVTSKRGATYGWRYLPSLCPQKVRYCDWHWHAGRDYANSVGVPIAILKKGEVIEKGGYCFKIKHYDNTITKYCHCDSVYFRKGDTVLPGDIIATVGNKGPSTGPHLHWEYFPPNQMCKTVTHASIKKGKVMSATACDVDPSGMENSYIVFVKNGKINDFKSDIKSIRSLG